ncbi:MAG: hypothetical protein ACRDTT_20710, partial [Pseudonocardiaceae bacterium]
AVYLTSERNAVARVVSAAGFPAVGARPPGDERGCFMFVSTTDGAVPEHPVRRVNGVERHRRGGLREGAGGR